MSVADDEGGTTLRADLADMAELHGLLDALRRDGLVLLEVRREPVPDSENHEDDGRLARRLRRSSPELSRARVKAVSGHDLAAASARQPTIIT